MLLQTAQALRSLYTRTRREWSAVEQQQRHDFILAANRLARPFLLIAFGGLTAYYLIASVYFNADGALFLASAGAGIIGSLLVALMRFFLRRQHDTRASITLYLAVFIPTVIVHIAVLLFRMTSAERTLFFALYPLLITLATFLGRITIVLGTIVSILVTLALTSIFPDPSTTLLTQGIILFSIVVTGLLMLIYFDTLSLRLKELSDVRQDNTLARRLDRIKDQFISSVNHELRTPVMAMQGFIELYLLGEDDMSERDRHNLIVEAKEVSENLVSLLESILAVRRIDQGSTEFTPEPVTMLDAVKTAVHLIDPREGKMVERSLKLHIEPDLKAMGEPVRVRQILTNLLSNALKYSPPGTPVEIDGFIVKIGGNDEGTTSSQPKYMVELTVRDYGLGIPPDDIPLLFQRFVRLERDMASTVVGNGLGLYLCRTYAESMGGSIWVESDGIPGHGSMFHLRLPLPGGDALAASLRARATAPKLVASSTAG